MARQLVLIPQKKPGLPDKYEERLQYRQWVTPQSLVGAPIHRWFVFPHSFGRDLVWELIDEWGLGTEDHILDPFVGAGTTLLAAKQRGIPATGVDLSPFAAFVSRTKLMDYDPDELLKAQKIIIARFMQNPYPPVQEGDAFLRKCFTPEVYQGLMALKAAILAETDENVRDFFLLGLLAILSGFSLAVRDGGWLRWQHRKIDANDIFPRFEARVSSMISDMRLTTFPPLTPDYRVLIGDARNLDLNEKYSAVITSPPYPNRHDYSRIFNVELSFAFLNDSEVKELRHQSFRSHVEASKYKEYDTSVLPASLMNLINKLKEKKIDRRVPPMLMGYFQDIYHTLISIKSVLVSGAKLAFVVGNVRYRGEMVEVDEILAHLAIKAGYEWLKTWIVRYRGNSAQQMGIFGRAAARECIIILQN
ncbi:MAG: hypothetical protein LAN71_18015 [Acidobacteriia bacterium]|nr:hypothetical protein [Terriglobia bacterium]